MCAGPRFRKASKASSRGDCWCLPLSVLHEHTTFLCNVQMSSAARRLSSSARLRTLHSRQASSAKATSPPAVRARGPIKDRRRPRLSPALSCADRRALLQSSLLLRGGAPSSLLVERLCKLCCYCLSFLRVLSLSPSLLQVKLAYWLLYVTPTTPFRILTSCQLAGFCQLCDSFATDTILLLSRFAHHAPPGWGS